MISVNYVKGTPNKIVKGDLDALLASKDEELQRLRDTIISNFSITETNFNPESASYNVENRNKSARAFTINRNAQSYYDIQPTGREQIIQTSTIPISRNLRLPALGKFKVNIGGMSTSANNPPRGIPRHQEITLYTGQNYKQNVLISPTEDFIVGLKTQYPAAGDQCIPYVMEKPKDEFDKTKRHTLVGNHGDNVYIAIYLPETRRLYCCRATATREGNLQTSRFNVLKRCILFLPERHLGASSDVTTVNYTFIFGNESISHGSSADFGTIESSIDAAASEHRNNFYGTSITSSSELQAANTMLSNDYINGYYENGRNYAMNFNVERIFDFSSALSCLILDPGQDKFFEINS